MTSITIKTDPQIKSAAKELFAQFGVDMTTAINMFLRQAVRTQSIPVDLRLNPNKETIEAINEVKKMKADPKLGKTYSDVDEMVKDLLS